MAKGTQRMIRNLMRIGAVALCALALAACSTVTPGRGQWVPDYVTATGVGQYKPVNVPGTQRREAQNDAELEAKRQLQEQAGAIRVTPTMTVNDIAAKDTKVRSELLSIIRNAELVDWKVRPECGEVQVWMRVDMNRVRQLVSCNR